MEELVERRVLVAPRLVAWELCGVKLLWGRIVGGIVVAYLLRRVFGELVVVGAARLPGNMKYMPVELRLPEPLKIYNHT